MAALAEARVFRVAMADPEIAPYGRAASEALRHAGVWEVVKRKLVIGENVAHAARFALSGGVDAGIVSYSLALSGPMASRGSAVLVPESWHTPLRQRMVLRKGAGAAARSFYDFLLTATAQDILRRHGFARP